MVETLVRMQTALESAGVVFIPADHTGGGVRLREASTAKAKRKRRGSELRFAKRNQSALGASSFAGGKGHLFVQASALLQNKELLHRAIESVQKAVIKSMLLQKGND